MKRVTILLALLGGLTLGVADVTTETVDTTTDTTTLTETTVPTETTTETTTSTETIVPTEVQVQARVRQMNEMKERMMQMSPEEREAAMAEMQASMNSGEALSESQTAQVREHASEMQMEHSSEMVQHQNMNQQQAGKQFQGEMEASSAADMGGSMNFGGRSISNH